MMMLIHNDDADEYDEDGNAVEKPSPYYYPRMNLTGALQPKQYPWLEKVYASPDTRS